jgi:hypothetical protein
MVEPLEMENKRPVRKPGVFDFYIFSYLSLISESELAPVV